MRGTTRIVPRGHALGRGLASPPFGARRMIPPDVTGNGITLPMARGPYQDNGASPWYAPINLGSPGQTMKMALDSGSNFIWVTSTLCKSGCQHYGNKQFDYQASETFSFAQNPPVVVSKDFGPWGAMLAELGRDYVALPGGNAVSTPFYCSSQYSGSQFAELDWDGGIGIPSGDQYADPDVPNFIGTLMNAGRIDPWFPYVSFCWDGATKTGTALLGGFDQSQYDPTSAIYLPFAPYALYPSVDYIWTSPLASMQMAGQTLVSNGSFCLDSGSSCFKGDPSAMTQALKLAGAGPSGPDLVLNVGNYNDGTPAQITVPPSVYDVTIEAGHDQGQTRPQFATMAPLDGLVLVGSVLMEQLYTIFEYSVLVVPGNQHLLAPKAMWLFNKTNGPELIRARSQKPTTLGKKPWLHVG